MTEATHLATFFTAARAHEEALRAESDASDAVEAAERAEAEAESMAESTRAIGYSAERDALLAARSIPALTTILAHPWEGTRHIEHRFVSDGHGCLALDGTTSEKWAKVVGAYHGDLHTFSVASLLDACDLDPDGAGTVSRDGRSYARLKLVRWVGAPCVATGMDRVAIRFGTKSLKAFGDGWQSMVMIKTCPDNDDRSWPEDVTS